MKALRIMAYVLHKMAYIKHTIVYCTAYNGLRTACRTESTAYKS